MYNSIPADRLEQKLKSLEQYLEKAPYSTEKKVYFAKLLASSGRFEEALKQVNQLQADYFYDEKLSQLKIQILVQLDKKIEIFQTVSESTVKFPAAAWLFQYWRFYAQNRFTEAEKLLVKELIRDPSNTTLRFQYINCLLNTGEALKAFQESLRIYQDEADNLEIFPVLLKGMLAFKSPEDALSYTKTLYENRSDSETVMLLYLHLLLRYGSKNEGQKIKTIYRQIKRKYFWHPDFILFKAQVEGKKLGKTLQRRSGDYPNCALTKHYQSYFCQVQLELPQLTIQETNHLETIKLIYKRTI